jgi:LPS-assembly protein
MHYFCQVNRSKQRKINVKTPPTIVIGIVLLLLTFRQESRAILVQNTPLFKDTLVKKADTVVRKTDSLINKTDTLILSKDSIDAPIGYNASDSGILIVETREFFLYGKAKTNYQDLAIEAATIRYNQQSKMVKAFGSIDSSGKLDSKPVFIQGEMKSISDTISFNMETGKGITKNTFFQEGEIFVNALTLKKMNDSVIYAKKARFTTCNLDTPHFAFRTGRMKIINNKMGISGPTFPEFEGVPMPIGIPFGIFPLNRGRHSGILAPAFTASEDFGLGLEGLGYYKVINDYLDFTTRANIYSYGGWNVNLNSKYIKRYAFTGGFNLTLQNTKSLNRFGGTGDEFNQNKSFMLNWSHSRDNRARPGTSFSANVNFGSSRFNRLLLNNPMQNFQNQLSSSISYSKDWRGKYNLSVNANHNQNNNLRLVNLQLPTVNFNVVTLYPFQSKEQIGAGKWYEKIGIGYSGNLQNQLSFYDTAFNFKRLLDTAQWGAVHNIPISMSLPALGPVTISPSISYEERWYGQKFIRSWNNANKKVDTVKYRGLYTARQMSFGISAATRIFGTYTFGKNSSIKGIRHEMRPTVSVNYQPDMAAAYHYSTQIDTTGRRIRFSQYEGGVVGSFSEGRFGGIGFGIDNLLEMKVRDKSDSTAKDKKVKLIEGFGISSSYNMLADSFKLGTFNLYARSTLFEKVNINASATLDPYDVDKMGYRLKTYAFDPKAFKFGRITSGSIAISTSFSSKSKDGKTEKDRAIPIDPFLTPDEQQRQLQFAKSNPAEFTDFNIPWTLSLSYSLSFSRQIKPDYSGFETRTFSSLNFNGDFSLTEKWKVGGTGYYDVSMGGLQQFSMFISREMHCWQMSINVMPVGIFRSFNITVNPKSGILRDLKINRSRVFSNSTF